jgi:hypothetical protein
MEDEQRDLKSKKENKLEASTMLAGAALMVLVGHLIWALLEYSSGIELNDCLYTVGRGFIISFGIALLSGLAIYANKKLNR